MEKLLHPPTPMTGKSLAEVYDHWRGYVKRLLFVVDGKLALPFTVSSRTAIHIRAVTIADVLNTLSNATDARVLVNPTPKEPRNAQ